MAKADNTWIALVLGIAVALILIFRSDVIPTYQVTWGKFMLILALAFAVYYYWFERDHITKSGRRMRRGFF